MTPAGRRAVTLKQWARLTERLVGQEPQWCWSRALSPADPNQGWKVHVSATVLSAVEVLRLAWPVLRRRNVLFKVPRTLDQLSALNTGHHGFAQVGKFLTLYPSSAAAAVQLARELDQATRGLPGPRVPYDRPLGTGSLVHYRYGAFRPGLRGRPEMVVDAHGRLRQDLRRPGRAVPRWIENPFPEPAGRPPRRGLLGLRFLPFRALSQRGKGGVYEALDLLATPSARCIIKEGRRHGETQWDGTDGASHLRHEAVVLRRLSRVGVAVPRILAKFNQSGHAYLVLEKLPGRCLFSPRPGRQLRSAPRRAARTLTEVTELLTAIHRAGWVWRDCKPTNILRCQGRLFAIDFEGACRPGSTDAAVWSTPEYAPPHTHDGFQRPVGFSEDIHALGVLTFQLATGRMPPGSPADRLRMLRRFRVPTRLGDRVEALLNGSIKSLAEA